MTTKENLQNYIKQTKLTRKGSDTEPIFQVATASDIDELESETGKKLGMPKTTPTVIGFYYDLDSAYDAIVHNTCDIWEHSYDYAFLFVQFPGLYESAGKNARMLFQYDRNTGEYRQIEEPAWFRHIAF